MKNCSNFESWNTDDLLKPFQTVERTTFLIAGDLFGDQVEDERIDLVFALVALCPQHIFHVRTNNPARLNDYCHRFTRGGERVCYIQSWAAEQANYLCWDYPDFFPDFTDEFIEDEEYYSTQKQIENAFDWENYCLPNIRLVAAAGAGAVVAATL